MLTSPDPSRTPMFYWLLAFTFSIFVSLSGYALLRLNVHAQSITVLETWREVRSEDVRRETQHIQSLRDTIHQHGQLLMDLKEQTRILENTVEFQGKQISYIIEWEKRQRGIDVEPLRSYPR